MSKLGTVKKIAIWILKEPVIKVTVGKHAKPECFVIEDTTVIHKYPNRKTAAKFSPNGIIIEGVLVKGLLKNSENK